MILRPWVAHQIYSFSWFGWTDPLTFLPLNQAELLCPLSMVSPLMSTERGLFGCPADRHFAVVAPALWNHLPLFLKKEIVVLFVYHFFSISILGCNLGPWLRVGVNKIKFTYLFTSTRWFLRHTFSWPNSLQTHRPDMAYFETWIEVNYCWERWEM